MLENEIKRYRSLNRLAAADGIVIFGCAEDTDIPLGELKQAFALDDNIYNRSVESISITDASEVYDECISELCPETVILHIGDSDVKLFAEAPADFEACYVGLIEKIREKDKDRRIVIVSLKNSRDDKTLTDLNKRLRYIAESQRCDFEDISSPIARTPRKTREIVEFLHSTGFVHPLKNKRPIYDLVRILFCYGD
ncbi:MAG: hypothetical protein IJ011_06195 [Clostridia bacterium]|nr:hypothetical protein [Clostridia bacterium]